MARGRCRGGGATTKVINATHSVWNLQKPAWNVREISENFISWLGRSPVCLNECSTSASAHLTLMDALIGYVQNQTSNQSIQ